MKKIIMLLIVFVAVGCAGQGGQMPQRPAPQAAKPYAQPTIQIGQPMPQMNLQPTLQPIIKERPVVMASTPTPQPDQLQHKTPGELLEDAQRDALAAQRLYDDCIEMAAREAAQGWIVDCDPLHVNLSEANRRLFELMEAAREQE